VRPVSVVAHSQAVDRLTELGLTVSIIERVVRRADAEASTCTEFDPPIMEGLTRWARTNRYLREELVPLGWDYDNPRNLARTIHPDGQFAIVAATGDELTGLAGMLPTTKHAKGDATIHAVHANFEQLTLFELGGSLDDNGDGLLTWFLLFHSEEHEFRAEVSLPNQIIEGRITGWAERIILPPFPRDPVALDGVVLDGVAGDGQDGHVVVEISRR
jgi:hypothetical protein